jgi:hypothetical protein
LALTRAIYRVGGRFLIMEFLHHFLNILRLLLGESRKLTLGGNEGRTSLRFVHYYGVAKMGDFLLEQGAKRGVQFVNQPEATH